MGEVKIQTIELQDGILKLPEVCQFARFYDICDLGGRILHKIDGNNTLEIDLSFLKEGKYALWTVCEGNAFQFHFTI